MKEHQSAPTDGKALRFRQADAKRMQFASPAGDHLTFLNLFKGYRRAHARNQAKTWARDNCVNLRCADPVGISDQWGNPPTPPRRVGRDG